MPPNGCLLGPTGLLAIRYLGRRALQLMLVAKFVGGCWNGQANLFASGR